MRKIKANGEVKANLNFILGTEIDLKAIFYRSNAENTFSVVSGRDKSGDL